MTVRRCLSLFLLVLVLLPAAASPAHAQAIPKQEFRGVWVASVANLDWPSSRNSSTATQKLELQMVFDTFQEAGINAVVFQVRPEGDALYDSSLEPWSYWLTGEQGEAPSPYFDPLAFAIEEAHARGMELHAWFNPYRMIKSVGSYAMDEEHVAAEHPEWLLDFDTHKMLDPGLPEVRAYNTSVVMDVVRRYDVDGIHFDDYFYPYSPKITSEDAETFQEYPRGFSSIDSWRRDNVNIFLEQVYDSVKTVKPYVKIGVSPFGIWKSGVPAGIYGLDAYSQIYADAVAWLEGGYVDYLAPQLYWGFGGGQDYARLAPWWAEQADGRHVYPGLAAYKADGATYSGSLYRADVVPDQIRFNRTQTGLQGNILFRSKNVTYHHTRGLTDSLEQWLYPYPALTPTMDWLDTSAPGTPREVAYAWSDDGDSLRLSWQTPADGEAEARRYVVYRTSAASPPDPMALTFAASHIAGITSGTEFAEVLPPSDEPYHYAVVAASANSVEGPASAVVTVEATPSAAEPVVAQRFAMEPAYPNPFRRAVAVRYVLEAPEAVTVHVFNSLGQRVQTLTAGERQVAGPHVVRWDGTGASGQALGSGTYFVAVDVAGQRHTQPVVLVR